MEFGSDAEQGKHVPCWCWRRLLRRRTQQCPDNDYLGNSKREVVDSNMSV